MAFGELLVIRTDQPSLPHEQTLPPQNGSNFNGASQHAVVYVLPCGYLQSHWPSHGT